MALFTIADLHLSLGTNKPMDIFPGWDGYLDLLEQNWKHSVAKDDTVVIPGDISWAMKLSECDADFSFLHQLPGTKLLLKGNHDYWFSTKTKVEQYLEEQGFDSIRILFNNSYIYGDYVLCGTRGWIHEQGEPIEKKVLLREAGRLRLSLEHGKQTGKQPIVFLHYPPIYGTSECYEILEVLLEYGVKQCFYGHIHGRSAEYAINGERKGIQFQLVAGDYVQFQPQKIVE